MVTAWVFSVLAVGSGSLVAIQKNAPTYVLLSCGIAYALICIVGVLVIPKYMR